MARGLVTTPSQGGQDGMRFVGNAELEARREDPEETPLETIQSRLAAHVDRRWQAAYRAKTSAANGEMSIEDQILEDYRQRDGRYSESKLQQIRETGGSEIYMELTSTKCRAADAWLEDMLIGTGDKVWGLEPSPIQDLSPDVEEQIRRQVGHDAFMEMQRSGRMPTPDEMQQAIDSIREQVRQQEQEAARQAAEQMETLIADQLHEGGWEQALRDAIPDITTTKAGIIKGPILRQRKRLHWVRGPNGQTMPEVREEVIPEYERVSPLDIYPGPDAQSTDDGYLIERARFRPEDLEAVQDLPGYDQGAIQELLRRSPEGTESGHLSVDQQRRDHEQRNTAASEGNSFVVLIYWGKASGADLREWGLPVEDDSQHEINAWLCDGKIIKAVLNPDPLGRRPYHKASYEDIPGAWWGRGIAELIRDLQQMCNAAARALVNNMGIASGPQIFINDTSRVPADEDLTAMYPWKIWQFEQDSTASTGHRPPIESMQPDPIADHLMNVYQWFSKLADDQSGIPSYEHGNADQRGGGATASGLSMLMDHAAKGLKRVVAAIDHGIIRQAVQRLYEHNMLFSPDEAVKGDLQVKARGPAALVEQHQHAAKIQDGLQLTSNQIDMQIIGLRGRAKLLRELLRTMDVPGHDDIIPSDDELAQREQSQGPSPDQIQAQIDQMKAQTDRYEAETERAKARSEIELNQERADRERTQALLDQVKAWAEANGLDPQEIDDQIQVEDAPQQQGPAGGAGAGGPAGQQRMGQGPGAPRGGAQSAPAGAGGDARGGGVPPAAGGGPSAGGPDPGGGQRPGRAR